MCEQERNISLAILHLSKMLQNRADEVAASSGQAELNGMQGFIVRYLHRATIENKVVYQKDIERMLNISRSTTSGILNMMEKKGVIRRCSVSQDGRLKQILLTESTKELQDEICRRMNQMDQALQNCLTEEERIQFCNMIEKMRRHLEEEKIQ